MHKSRIRIAGRVVVIATGEKSQTINVCTRAGSEGQYDAKVRLRPPFISETTLARRRFASIDDLIEYLKREHGGSVEQPVPAARAEKRTAVTAKPGLLDRLFGRRDNRQPSPTQASAPSQPARLAQAAPLSSWEVQAKRLLEQAIDRLVLDFVHQPYLHRVEHSLHSELYRLLTSNEIFGEKYPMGQWMSQTVHKEWPEWTPRPEKANRRGNFDICIISPDRLAQSSYEGFRQGRIAPSFVVELGLDYKIDHLRGDLHKLGNSGLPGSYIVHLVRQDVSDAFEEIERLLIRSHPVKTAYARIASGRAFYSSSDKDAGRV